MDNQKRWFNKRCKTCKHCLPICPRCNDTGFVPAGMAAPLTGMECSCDLAKAQQAEFKRVAGLEQRIRELEAVLATIAIEGNRGTP